MYNLCCIIMASGFSKRMGVNKLLLEFRGRRLFEYVVSTVSKLKLKEKIMVSSYDEIIDFCKSIPDFETVENMNNNFGQSQSIVLGVSNCKVCDGFIFLPCDMPFIEVFVIKEICDFFYLDTRSIVVPRADGKNSMPTIFPYKFKEELLSLKGDMGGRDIIKSNPEIVRYLDIKNPLFLKDIDTQEDYKRYS